MDPIAISATILFAASLSNSIYEITGSVSESLANPRTLEGQKSSLQGERRQLEQKRLQLQLAREQLEQQVKNVCQYRLPLSEEDLSEINSSLEDFDRAAGSWEDPSLSDAMGGGNCDQTDHAATTSWYFNDGKTELLDVLDVLGRLNTLLRSTIELRLPPSNTSRDDVASAIQPLPTADFNLKPAGLSGNTAPTAKPLQGLWRVCLESMSPLIEYSNPRSARLERIESRLRMWGMDLFKGELALDAIVHDNLSQSLELLKDLSSPLVEIALTQGYILDQWTAAKQFLIPSAQETIETTSFKLRRTLLGARSVYEIVEAWSLRQAEDDHCMHDEEGDVRYLGHAVEQLYAMLPIIRGLKVQRILSLERLQPLEENDQGTLEPKPLPSSSAFMSSLKEIVTSPTFLRELNEYEFEQAADEDSTLDDIDTIPELVFELHDDPTEAYERFCGLVAYPESGSFEVHSRRHDISSKPSKTSGHEAKLRSAFGMDRAILLVTVSDPMTWSHDSSTQGLASWTALTAQDIPGNEHLAQHAFEKQQRRMDNANVELNVLGKGYSLRDLLGIIWSWFNQQDMMDLYMAWPRQLHMGANTDETSTYELERRLFNTMQYSQYSTNFTVVTFGDSAYGTVELYETIQNDNGFAQSIKPVAAAKRVPRKILKNFGQKARRIELERQSKRTRYLRKGGQPDPQLARVETRVSQQQTKEWQGLGQAWREALNIAPTSSSDGLVATIPQMMSFLHLDGSGLHGITTTSAQEFSTPLSYHLPTGPPPVSDTDSNVKRGVKITKGPRCDCHLGEKVRILVIFPTDCQWADERLLWF